ncbi:MAG: hypothetical protein U9P90_00125 [Patescibacteria group bacterium]|nr:hypothetical protein [Patescibacteria group bacterium]
MKIRQVKLNTTDRLLVGIIGIALVCDLIFPKIAIAKEPIVVAEEPEKICVTVPREIYCGNIDSFELPSLTLSKDVPLRTFWVYVTAYSSTPDQTDDTPFITANGSHVRDGIVATNILKFKTRIKFPDEYGDKWFTVEDRMNSRYNNKNRMDIWMETREQAIQFGARWLEAEVY